LENIGVKTIASIESKILEIKVDFETSDLSNNIIMRNYTVEALN